MGAVPGASAATVVATVSRPSVARLRSSSTLKLLSLAGSGVMRPSQEISHTPCLASKATEGSLARSYLAPEKTVACRIPRVNVLPPLVAVEKPIPEAPPLRKRPYWNAEQTDEPTDRVTYSTSA